MNSVPIFYSISLLFKHLKHGASGPSLRLLNAEDAGYSGRNIGLHHDFGKFAGGFNAFATYDEWRIHFGKRYATMSHIYILLSAKP